MKTRFGMGFSVVAMAAAMTASAVEFDVAFDRPDATYKCGEKATFSVTAKPGKDETEVKGVVTCSFSDYSTNAAFCTFCVDLATAQTFKVSNTLRKPGFLKLSLGMEGVRNPPFWSAAFDPTKIHKGSPSPKNFDTFWKKSRQHLAKTVPLDPQVVHVPERSTKDYEMYRVSFASLGRRVYGQMTLPKNVKPPYAASVQICSHGWADYSNFTRGNRKVAVLWFTVFPFETDWEWRTNGLTDKFKALQKECIDKWGVGFETSGYGGKITDPFYYPLILGIDRAVDWLAKRPDIDKTRIFYNGGSQGGGLGLMLVGLNHVFCKAYFSVPAITDIMGYRVGRISGWPRPYESTRGRHPEFLESMDRNLPYFDAANFASRVTCPVRMTIGFRDTICPAPAVYSAYNELKVADKGLEVLPQHGHGTPDNVTIKNWQWLGY